VRLTGLILARIGTLEGTHSSWSRRYKWEPRKTLNPTYGPSTRPRPHGDHGSEKALVAVEAGLTAVSVILLTFTIGLREAPNLALGTYSTFLCADADGGLESP